MEQIKDSNLNSQKSYLGALKNKSQEYFEDNDYPIDLISLKYDESSKSLKVSVIMYLKAYGSSYTRTEDFIGTVTEYNEDKISFDNSISEFDANILYPLGIVKTNTHYPTRYFRFYNKLELKVNRIELNIQKDYD